MVDFMVLIGPSGSGKSTWANKFIKENPSYHIVATDTIRGELWGDENDQQNPQKVFNTAYSKAVELLNSGLDVVFDATNLKRKDRVRLLNYIDSKVPGVYKSCRVFTTTDKLCKSRQELRDRKVPDEVIDRQFKNFMPPTEDEGWDEIKFIN